MRKKARQEVEKKIGRVYGGQAHNKQKKKHFSRSFQSLFVVISVTLLASVSVVVIFL